MQPMKNTKQRYGFIAMFLHWFMALLIVAMLILGFYMVTLPNVGFNSLKSNLIFVHKELGVLVLTLATVRLIWRLCNIVPSLSSPIPRWQKFAAHSVHFTLYGLMFSQPITGWLMSSAAGFSVTYFGLFELPALISPNVSNMHLLSEIHKWLAYGFILTLIVHISAGLMHHFIYKDKTLWKILP